MSGVPDPVGLVTFLAIGLFGGAHCLGMCGPLVTAYGDRLAENGGTQRQDHGPVGWYELRQHLLFNSGRTASYALVGGVMGAIGAVVFETAAVLQVATGVRGVAGVATGLVVLAVGLSYLVRGPAGRVDVALAPGVTQRLTGFLTRRLDRWTKGPRIAGLGMVHAALPCPIIYPAYLYALARGSPLEGALALGAVGLGTFPTLFAYGTVFQSLGAGRRATLHRVLGALFVVLGYIPLSHGLSLLGVPVPTPAIPVFRPL